MAAPKPLKRHTALQPLSRDHHHGLLLCWKIRSGLAKNVAVERVKAYVDWVFAEQLLPHFDVEERHVFPLLGDSGHPFVKRALREHRRLKRLLADAPDQLDRRLNQFEELLAAHIRFEERILFNELQTVATPAQLAEIQILHPVQGLEEKWDDLFWK
jgi:hypothetical protein